MAPGGRPGADRAEEPLELSPSSAVCSGTVSVCLSAWTDMVGAVPRCGF